MGLHASKFSSVKEQDIIVHKNFSSGRQNIPWNAWKPIDTLPLVVWKVGGAIEQMWAYALTKEIFFFLKIFLITN